MKQVPKKVIIYFAENTEMEFEVVEKEPGKEYVAEGQINGAFGENYEHKTKGKLLFTWTIK